MLTGLTSAEVKKRQKAHLTNRTNNKSSRSLWQIIRANIFTRFNALISTLAVVVFLSGKSPINALFFIAMLLNILVGVAQEIKAKRTLDKLSILVSPHATVTRNGQQEKISANEVVKDDLINLNLGDQIVADGEIILSNGLEVDESLLTGESDQIKKSTGDKVLSGSIVVAGSALMTAQQVGKSSYSAKLAAEAKQFKLASSELVESTNKLLKWISWILIAVAPLLVWGQLKFHDQWQDATIHAVAAIVGMIPEGLVLLTSAAFMLAVVKLAKNKVLVQQLPAVETLARVNTLLLDKTGTITAGKMNLDEIKVLNKSNLEEIKIATLTLVNRANSPTNKAIKKGLKEINPAPIKDEIAFNSARKWSAISIDKDTNYIMGAPEILLKKDSLELSQAQTIFKQGKRALLIGRLKKWPPKTNALKLDHISPLGLIVLSEEIRSDARETLSYFKNQGVDIKIISGDSPITVESVANSVGLKAKSFDARNLPEITNLDSSDDLEKLQKIIDDYNVFGRVQPEQKRLIADALQKQGRVVAMTGDGVNDALALKKADLGIAMNSGAEATKSVAEIVLLNNKFSCLPSVLLEGRRVIANIERVANLFIIKNVYSFSLALAVTAIGLSYPFMPAQMTVISTLSIGVPAFFLALAPNKKIYKPGFLGRIIRFALPVGVIESIAMFATYYIAISMGYNNLASSTAVTITAMMISLTTLIVLSAPIKGWKVSLITACALTFLLLLFMPKLASPLDFQIELSLLPIVLISGAIGGLVVIALNRIILKKH